MYSSGETPSQSTPVVARVSKSQWPKRGDLPSNFSDNVSVRTRDSDLPQLLPQKATKEAELSQAERATTAKFSLQDIQSVMDLIL